MFMRVCFVLSLLAVVSVAGSWMIEESAPLPPGSSLAAVGEVASPPVAVALPMETCGNFAWNVWLSRESLEWSMCRTMLGCTAPDSQAAIDDSNACPECVAPGCRSCAFGVQAKANSAARPVWEDHCGPGGDYCSAGNPYC